MLTIQRLKKTLLPSDFLGVAPWHGRQDMAFHCRQHLFNKNSNNVFEEVVCLGRSQSLLASNRRLRGASNIFILQRGSFR